MTTGVLIGTTLSRVPLENCFRDVAKKKGETLQATLIAICLFASNQLGLCPYDNLIMQNGRI